MEFIPQNQVTTQNIETRIGELAAALAADEARAQRFGVILRDIEPIDPVVFVRAALKHRKDEKLSLRIAIPDRDLRKAIPKVQKDLKEVEAELLTDSEEITVDWRNKHLRTIIVLANKPLTKGSSLRDFSIRDDRDLLAFLVRQKAEDAATAFLRNFWKALIDRKSPDNFRLAEVVGLALELEALPSDNERSLYLKNFLPLLGLLKDSGIADKNTPGDIAKRLADNYKLVEAARASTVNDRKRMQAYVDALEGKDKGIANKIKVRLKKLPANQHDQQLFGELDFPLSQKVWLGRKPTEKRSAENNNATSKPVQSLSLQAIINQEPRLLDDLYESVKQAIEKVEDGDSEGRVVELSQEAYGSRATLPISQDLLRLIRAGTSEEAWGIIVDVEELSETAILQVEEWGTRSVLSFNGEEGPGDLIRKFVEAEALGPNILTLAEELQRHRRVLLEHLPGLAAAPLTTLAARADVRAAAENYLKTYSELLEAVSAGAQEARNASSLAEKMFASLAVLETWIFRHGEEIAAVLSPIHPLHLWRWVMATGELFARREEFNQAELEAIEETLASHVHYLTSLHLPEEATQLPAVDLGLAGEIKTLPFYRRNPRALGIEDGVGGINRLVNALAQMRPFVRPGLRVVLVNPPCPEIFVKELVKQAQPDTNSRTNAVTGLHLRIRYTADDAASWVTGMDDLEEETRERVGLGQRIGRVSLDVSGEKVTPKKLEEELRENPAHLTVVFDPFEVRRGMFRREGSFSLNPWVLSYRYEYDRIQKKVTQIPIADANIFGSYLQLVGVVEPRLRNQTVAHAANADESAGHLATLAESSTWLVIADRHGVPISSQRVAGTFCVDVRQEHQRTLTTLAHDLEPFEQELARELRNTFFNATKETLTSIVTDLVALEPGGILGVGSVAKEGDRTTKAALGKIVVVRSYRRDTPSGLAVSLDTPEARQWLVAGQNSRRQADLIGLRETEDGGLCLDILEVKTHDAGTLFTVENGVVRGEPVDQVMATYRAVASIFGAAEADSPLARPRREVLRNHLYQACLRDADAQFKERWHSLLNDLFDRKIKLTIQAQIVRVQLASVAPSTSSVFTTPEGIPILFRVLNAEEVGLTLQSIATETINKQIEPELRAALQAGRALAPELDPADAMGRLQHPTAAQSEQESAPDKTDKITEEQRVVIDAPSRREFDSNISKKPEPAVEESEETPYPAAPLSVLLGKSRSDHSLKYWEVAKQANGFFMILGASGSGKTETLKVVAAEIHRYGIPCIIFDFHGDVVLGGAEDYVLSHGPASTYGINPMELDSTDPADGGVYAQINILLSMLKACVPSLGHRQWRVIKDVLNEAYEQVGINDKKPDSWQRQPPTFAAVLQLLEQKLEDDTIARAQRNIIESAFDAIARVFEHPVFARDSQIQIEQLLARSHRLNLAHLEEEIRFVVTDTLLRKLARALKSRGSIPVQPQNDYERYRLFVFIDEAKILALGGKDRDSSSAILNTLATEYRKFGLGMILASQMSDHFSNETKGQIATRLVLKPFDYSEAKKNAPDINRTAEDLMQLAGRGDGYLRSGTQASPVRIHVIPLSERIEKLR